jgi:hypothetical protein
LRVQVLFFSSCSLLQKVLAAHGAAKVSAYVTHAVFPKQSWSRFVANNSGTCYLISYDFLIKYFCVAVRFVLWIMPLSFSVKNSWSNFVYWFFNMEGTWLYTNFCQFFIKLWLSCSNRTNQLADKCYLADTYIGLVRKLMNYNQNAAG